MIETDDSDTAVGEGASETRGIEEADVVLPPLVHERPSVMSKINIIALLTTTVR